MDLDSTFHRTPHGTGAGLVQHRAGIPGIQGRHLRRGLRGRGPTSTAGRLYIGGTAVSLIAAITLAASFVPMVVHLSPLLVAAPTFTAAFARVRFTVGIALLACAATVVIDTHDTLLRSPILAVHIGALLAVSSFVVAARALHDRDLRELTQVRAVSQAAQQVLLRPIPSRLGPVSIACEYRAAAEHAMVGGDLYAAARTGTATRILIGDVRGKGLAAIEDTSAVLGAFREAAPEHATLPELVAALERSVRRHLAELAACDPEAGERFITALVVEIPDRGGVARVVSCGHPPPLLRHDGRVRVLEALRPAPPLGLAHTDPGAYHLESVPFAPGDTLLLYTDGVIEARDADGGFYPILDRAAAWTWESPDGLLRHISRDLDTYTGGYLDDDLAMVAVRWGRAPGAVGDPCFSRSSVADEALT
ncbi:PP2C family protein-serine/threonine phosphatase [Streptomyces sp. NPDC127159]|uniref:PP2C family protein-serine/threonine phosphatase n=1 Tax=unclassified Streptomyces TaxID=2593676 RepID=UPI00363E1698